jgi:hypothetical protein
MSTTAALFDKVAEDFSRCDHIVLDEYQWMKRWNDIVLDMKSEEAAIFKGCMRRAINVVSNNEYLTKRRSSQSP